MSEQSEENLPATLEDLPPITEELNPEERAAVEQKMHRVQPPPANKFVFLSL